MDLAWQLALHGATPGTAVLAGHQESGRGRSGRSWTAPPWSSLLLSFITHSARDPQSLGALSLLLGVAVADTVVAVSGQEPAIKWPNDVLVDGRKIAGILVVNKAIPGRADRCLIAGIGLNVNVAANDLPDSATSLAIETGRQLDLDNVLANLLESLTTVVDQFARNGAGPLIGQVNDRLAFRDEVVSVLDGPRVHEGRVRGVDPAGALILVTAPGTSVRIVAGEVTRGPRQAG
jgi:BirA family biotin operon repressor/biotin-[acetyl-CoA-carboxylase] ligase